MSKVTKQQKIEYDSSCYERIIEELTVICPFLNDIYYGEGVWILECKDGFEVEKEEFNTFLDLIVFILEIK